MGKLLGQIFKKDIKSALPWFVIPLVFALINTQLIKVFGEHPLVMVGLSITLTLVVVGPFAALISVAVNDYERFYGKYAAFYSALPYKSSTINWARFLNYLLMVIVAGLFAIINYFILLIVLVDEPISFTQIFEFLGQGINILGIRNLIGLVVYLLALVLISILQVMFSITAGSTRILGKPSMGKVIAIFIVTSLILGFVFARIQIETFINYESLQYLGENGANIEVVNDQVQGYKAILAPLGFNTLASLLLAWATQYLHDRKLSVA